MKKLLCIILLSLTLCLPAFGQFNDTEPMFGQMLNLGHWSTDGLVFYWRGIEAGNVVDESFFGNDGTITGATWVGDGLSFDGNDNVTLFSVAHINAAITDEYTIAIRFFSRTISTYSIVGGGQDTTGARYSGIINTGVSGTATIGFDLETVGGQMRLSTAAVNANNVWYYVVGTYKSGVGAKLYIDGREADSDNSESGNIVEFDSFVFGIDIVSGLRGLNGVISDIKIYNRAFSNSEISALSIDPELPMAQDPIWLLFSPEVAPSGIVPIIQAHTRRRRAG